jgi:hypothetical protein
MANPITEQEVKAFLTRWTRDYDTNSPSFFDLFTPEASIFTISQPTRIDGRENFKSIFEPHFSGRRRSQVLAPDIQIHGDVATVSCHNRVSVDDRITNLRTSMTLIRASSGNLEISHLHQSPLTTPTAGLAAGAAAGTAGITLLEERVATAAAAVGTPK